ncbi:MAG TPA: ABC transporter ATP-binding protein [bacterium]|nr:ABC transporter ATP-binding protein [bacterium]
MDSLITLDGVTKTYHLGEVDVPALRGITMEIKRGEFVAIMGASGSGKTSLLNVIGCLDRPSGGKYLLDGLDITVAEDDELAAVRNRKIGFVFQSYNLLPRTDALENVEMPLLYGPRTSAKEKRDKAIRLLTRVGLESRVHHHPTQLSGGEQQRVAIARALINEPPLILADEPTGNLDTKSSREIMAIFTELHGDGITLVMVTHEDDIAKYAQRVITVRDGVVI